MIRSMSAARMSASPSSRMPVRRTIHSESTPMPSAISALATTRSGSLWPRPMIRAVRSGIRPANACSSAVRVSGIDELLGGRLDLGARDDPLGEAREHLAGPDLDEALGAGVVQSGEGLPPADGADERCRQLFADVREGLGRGAGDDGEARLAEVRLGERLAEGMHGRLHRGGVEGAGDREADRALAELLRP